MSKPSLCPKLASCSAPVCPLDPHWRSVPHLRGERICFWLAEVGKQGGEGRVASTLQGVALSAVTDAYREMSTEATCSPTESAERCVGQGHGLLRNLLRKSWNS